MDISFFIPNWGMLWPYVLCVYLDRDLPVVSTGKCKINDLFEEFFFRG